MSNYEKVNGNTQTPPNPPPYSAQQAQDAQDPLKYPMGPAPPTDYGAAPPMPTQYQGYYMPPGSVPMQGPILQQPQAVYITPVQPVNEPDYLAYSIFTLLCCCLPLGIAALVYSIQTREANQAGNLTAAKKYSRLARTLAQAALGVGIGFIILYIVIVVILTTTTATIYSSSIKP